MNGQVLRFFPFVLGGLLLAVLFHILIVLTLPHAARRTSGQIIASQIPASAGTPGTSATPPKIVPVSSPGAEIHPFADPAFAMAFCAFDLANGPFQIRAPVGETFTSLVIASPNGTVLHALSDKASIRRVLDVVLVTAAQQRMLESLDPEDEPVQEIRIRPGVPQGTVALKVFAPRPADADPARELLARMQCQTLTER